MTQRVRIAITGAGLVTPVGKNLETSWGGLLSGARAVRWLESAELQATTVPNWEATGPWFGAPCSVPSPSEPTTVETEERRGPLLTYAMHAAGDAIQQADLNAELLRQAVCVIGASKPDLGQLSHAALDPARALSDLWRSPATEVAQHWACRGGVSAPAAACATGLVSLIQAAELIRTGAAPVVLAGGADASLAPGPLASYRRLGVMARPTGDPAQAARPFDRGRTGFAVGAGAGVLVLEDWRQAQRRGARIWAEWIDGVIGADPSGLTAVDASGAALEHLIAKLFRRAGRRPEELGLISAHATGTRLNDQAEAQGLHRALGDLARRIPVFALKGGLGHLMGAAGAVETAATVLALRDQLVPPTVNCDEFDPELPPLCCRPEVQSWRGGPLALKLSLGFGGHLAAGLLRAV